MKKTAIRKLVKTSIAFFFVIFIALGNISLKAQQSATGLSQDEARELWEQRQFEVEDLYMQGELEDTEACCGSIRTFRQSIWGNRSQHL